MQISTPNIVISVKCLPEGAPLIDLARLRECVPGVRFTGDKGAWMSVMTKNLKTGTAKIYNTGSITYLGCQSVAHGRLFIHEVLWELNRVNAIAKFSASPLVPLSWSVVNVLRKWDLGYTVDRDKIRKPRNMPLHASVTEGDDNGLEITVMLRSGRQVSLQVMPESGVVTILKAYNAEQEEEFVGIVSRWLEKARMVTKDSDSESDEEVDDDTFVEGTLETVQAYLADALRDLSI